MLKVTRARVHNRRSPGGKTIDRLHAVSTLTRHLPDSAVVHLFERELEAGRATWLSLPGGATLFKAGEVADHLYLLRTGRLAAVRRDPAAEPQFLGLIRPGEVAGEMSLIVGSPHSADVVALRDSEVFALPREDFFEASNHDARTMTELARLLILRSRRAATKGSLGEPSVFGFIGACAPLELRPVVERIGAAIEALGYAVVVVGAEVMQAPTEWFSDVEHTNDFVLYCSEHDEDDWSNQVSRQVDRVFRVARGGAPPPTDLGHDHTDPMQQQQMVDLILVQDADCLTPSGSESWLDAIKPARIFHVRDSDPADAQRLARVITGQSVGVVLSGGGARAYAHVGAIHALRRQNVPIDFICGVSMGAIVAAGVAIGWSNTEMDERLTKAFVDTSPLDDIAFPLLAMTRGLKVDDRLFEHFGERHIADLWIPYFCLSSDLTSGAYNLHRRGRLRDALRASIALPGVMPPVALDGHVLVDGAVLKNFPADIMRATQTGPIVGVDVTFGRNIDAEDMKTPPALWRWVLSGDWRKGPPIVSLLMRAATISTGRDLIAAREATDVLVTPDVEGVEIRNWKAYAPAVQAGDLAMTEALAKLDKPVQDLRRRPSLAELTQI